MKLSRFKVTNFRNVHDSGWINVNKVTALVGQNESGKSNLCEALYKLNPFQQDAKYNIDEDWPADKWGEKDSNRDSRVCEAEFVIDDEDEIRDLCNLTTENADSEEIENEEDKVDSDENNKSSKKVKKVALPKQLMLRISSYYDNECKYELEGKGADAVDEDLVEKWAKENLPKCVYIYDYALSGAQVELNSLAEKFQQVDWEGLSSEEQTIHIILELAHIDIEDFLEKGKTASGRTLRSFDKRQASKYLTQQFATLWKQKEVRFDIDIDATTLNIFVEDVGLGMPIRLNRRSTGFRWYVSFAWNFTHASKGQYKDCILLLEEPGIHLHHEGHIDLLELFETLATNNTIIYTTHLATLLDFAYPERVRIVEVHDHQAKVLNGIVSSQKSPMMVIEARLGLSGNMSGLLGNRQTLIVEGGDDALILQKLSGLLAKSNKEYLSERIYLFPAEGAPKTPMYAAFLIGQEWDSGVLLDSDEEGNIARDKMKQLYLKEKAEEDNTKFRIFMLGKAAGIKKTDAAIEDIFPEKFYLECVNAAYGISIKEEDLPADGSTLITKRVEKVLIEKHGRKELDKGLTMKEMLKHFDKWQDASDLPEGTAERAAKLFKKINASFSGHTNKVETATPEQ